MKRIKRFRLMVSLILMLVYAPVSQGAPPPPDAEAISVTAPSHLPSRTPGKQTNRQSSLDSVLAAVAAAAKRSIAQAIALAEARGVPVSGDRVQVQIVTQAVTLRQVMAAVTGAGGEVTGAGYDDTVIQGWLPVGALERLAAQSEVDVIRRPRGVVLLETLQIGASTTEGLAALDGLDWHTAGYTGTGVKIGIIDGGFQDYPVRQGTGDLPPSLTVKNFVDGESDAQANGTSPHGTAVAEIIHDIAPDGALYLAKIYSEIDLAEAVTWLIDQQVDIISTSVGFYNVSPGDGTGMLADLASQARSAGILWVTAAGNDRVAHWGGADNNIDGDPFHEFPTGTDVNCFVFILLGDDQCFPFSLFFAGDLHVFLRWSDWQQVDQDFDLHLVQRIGGVWQTVASSTDLQNGGAGQTPTEWITFSGVDPFDANPYGVRIERVSGNQPVNFELFTPALGGLFGLQQVVHARSIANLADAPEALTVAAVDINAPYPQEFYSSEGPTNGPGGTESGGFIKPEIAAFANVSTQTYGAGLFSGTSSATPHVAGAAALVLSAFPGYSPAQIQNFLESRAIDMGSPGLDPDFGYGRLHLGDPPGTINTAPVINGLPDQTVPLNSSLDNAIDLWSYSGDAQDVDGALSFTISNSPPLSAGVTIDANRYIDIMPTLAWSGTAGVEIRVQDTGGLTATDTLSVTVTDQPAAALDTTLYLPAITKRHHWK